MFGGGMTTYLLLGGAAYLLLTPGGKSMLASMGIHTGLAGLGRVTGGGLVSNPAGWAGTDPGTRSIGPGFGALVRRLPGPMHGSGMGTVHTTDWFNLFAGGGKVPGAGGGIGALFNRWQPAGIAGLNEWWNQHGW